MRNATVLITLVFILSACDSNVLTNSKNSNMGSGFDNDPGETEPSINLELNQPSAPNDVITSINSGSFPISGICEETLGDVTVTFGDPAEAIETFSCTSGVFSGAANLSSGVTSSPLSVFATQDSVTSPELTILNDQIGPVTPTATPPGGPVGGVSYDLSLNCTEVGEVISVFGSGITSSPIDHACTTIGAEDITLPLISGSNIPSPNNLTLTAVDQYGNPSASTGSVDVPIDTVAPSITLSSSDTQAPGSDADGVVTVTVTASENVSTLEVSDFTLTNTAITSLGGGPQVYTLELTAASTGTFSITLDASTVLDAVGNENVESNTLNFIKASLPTPTFTVTADDNPYYTMDATGSSAGSAGGSIATYHWTVYEGVDTSGAVLDDISAAAGASLSASAHIDGGTAESPNFNFCSACQSYHVCLNVTDNSAQTSATPFCQTYTVNTQTMSFDVIAKANEYLDMRFTPVAGASTPIQWDFGNGTTFTGSNSSGAGMNVYSSAGTYAVNVNFCPGEIQDWDTRANSNRAEVDDFDAFDAQMKYFCKLQKLVFTEHANVKLTFTKDKFKRMKDLSHLQISFSTRSSPGRMSAIPVDTFEDNIALTTIDLGVNNIPGTLDPNHFINNVNLQTLMLGGNQFTGSLPAGWIDHLPALKEFRVNGNQLSGAIPVDFFDNNPNLETLDIGNNDFTGTLQSDLIANNTQLTTFRAQDNQFTGSLASTFFSTNTVLESIYLMKNNLSGALDANLISNNLDLEIFRVGDNQFSGSIPSGFLDNNPALIFFELTDNQLSGSLPLNLFANNTNLGSILVSDNMFTGGLPSLVSNNALTTVRFENNQFSGSIPTGYFDNKTSLARVNFTNNQLSGSIPAGLFDDNTNLVDLRFENNLLSGSLPANLFPAQPKLTGLHMSDNSLTGVIPASFLDNLPKLRHLSLQNNLLTGALPPGLFDNNPELRTLFINNNSISGASGVALVNNPDLKDLRFNDNGFTSSDVDNWLVDLDANGSSNGRFFGEAQSPAAPPSGVGLAAETNLMSKGWNVSTD